MPIGTPTSLGTTSATTTSASISLNITSAVASGLHVIVFAYGEGTTNPTCSGGSLTWQLDKFSHVNDALVIFSAYAPSGLTSGTTITVDFSNNSDVRLISAVKISGLKTSSWLDVTASTGNTGTDSWGTGTTATRTTATQISFGAATISSDEDDAVHTSTPTAPATEIHDFGVKATTEHQIPHSLTSTYVQHASTGTTQHQGTWTTGSFAGNGDGVIVTYKASQPTMWPFEQAVSSNLARPISAVSKYTFNRATSVNTARPMVVGPIIIQEINQVVETEEAVPLRGQIDLNQVTETEQALPITRYFAPIVRQQAEWQYYICDSSDMTPIAEITRLSRDVSFNLALNQAGSASFRVPSNSDWNDFLVPIKYGIIARRNKEIVWSGMIWTKNEDFATQNIQIECVGWLETLFHRFYTSGGNVVWTNVNAAQIIYDILALANADHDTWISEGTTTNTQTRTVTLEPFQNFGEQIRALTEVENGVDIEVDPETRELNIFAAEDYKVSGAVFDFNITRSNLNTFSRSFDAANMSNEFFIRGSVGTAEAIADDSVSYSGQLLQQVISVNDTADLNLLGAIANAELAVNAYPRVLHTFLPKADPNKSPQFFEDYNIRDQIAVRARRDNLLVEGVTPTIPNGTFEGTAIGWGGYNGGTIGHTTSDSHSGTGSGLVTTQNTTNNGAITDRVISSVNPSTKYRYTIWVKAPVGYKYIVGVWLYQGNEISTITPGSADFVNAFVTGDNTWQQSQITFTTTKFTAYANLGVYADSGQTGTTFKIDDASIELIGDSVTQKTRIFAATVGIDINGNQIVSSLTTTYQAGG